MVDADADADPEFLENIDLGPLWRIKEVNISPSPLHSQPPTFTRFVYFPPEDRIRKSYSFSGQYYTGNFLAKCSDTNYHLPLQCRDHGQFPWGRNRFRGAMALLSYNLGIDGDSGVCNTCLPTHLLVAMLNLGIFIAKDLLAKHWEFLVNVLLSN